MSLRIILHFFSLCTYYVAGKATSECDNVIELAGGGGEFSSAVYQAVGAKYATERSSVRKVHFSYEKVNSAYGIERITMQRPQEEPAVFAGVEITLEPMEKKMFPNLVTFPILAGAMVMMFNLPHINKINLTVNSVAEIYLGNITMWNDYAIQSVNPDIVLPAKRILPVARYDHCGESFIFTTALSSVSRRWSKNYGVFSDPLFEGDNVDCCNSTKWPKGVISFYGNRAVGMVGVVSSISYTIGYAANSNTIEGTAVTYANLINTYGQIVEPTMQSIQMSMDYVISKETKETIKSHLEYNINNVPLADAYPFASFSYMIVNRTTHPNVTCCQMEELTGLIDHLFSPNVQEVITSRGLVPISPSMADYIRRNVLSNILCRGEFVYQQYNLTLISNTTLSEHEKIIIAVASVFGASGLIIGIFFAYTYMRNKTLNENLWLLKDIRMINKSSDFDRQSVQTRLSQKCESVSGYSEDSRSSGQNNGYFFKGFSVQTETDILLLEFDSTNGFKFDRKTKNMLLRFQKEFLHVNLFQFLGITFIDKKLYLVNQYTSFKGTLHHVLESCPYNIDTNIKFSFAKDILSGVQYLHQKRIAHGLLNSLQCYLTTTWGVKIACWELMSIYFSENDYTNIFAHVDYVPSTAGISESDESLIKLLYKDPDYLKAKTVPPYLCDIYAIGVLFIEIFTRKIPYFKEVELGLTTYPNVIKDKFERFVFWPDLNTEDVPLDVQNLIRESLARWENRPDIVRLSKLARPLMTTEKGIVDLLMLSVENYMNQLEDKIDELTSVTGRMKDLLYDVLPPQIAEKMFQGESVEPEFYECCTIFFSDIVGFTTISAQSTPIQVMKFLNDVYTKFDNIIEEFDVYKVDTIGDAYMVASGLPVENGICHCKCIGLMALDLLKRLSGYNIPHMNGDKLRFRMGINSGPVTAGIIGRKMPQYCVFGDTVNTACRMESTSMPGKIQVSETTNNLFQTHFPEFVLKRRGEIEVKGKGKMTSYWLLSCKDESKNPIYMNKRFLECEQPSTVRRTC